jgi:hypothetical protein
LHCKTPRQSCISIGIGNIRCIHLATQHHPTSHSSNG